ncbi:MAG: NADH-quinone oxidoreductase subunit NuoH [Syntrophobacterales bacterium CG_4_8_14_3_um_filter_58_8]|nr:MAG: NADH-quinone oxidoreductase subunit H [Syntrophaceae bacterium CG2_30_58_14]PIV06012.1 MAG: NADH-quinone oxidoreductase subunit NuoH [Syntrophobacterales bacterium CG03_land_8_20_14_0_80_58_14]PJC75047.1 MAG: NADH-quinone oxidoreductase subunit NuoH [Syntrophobacterales bacterium CG_4_8_14_3_um_filter_58_8]
MEQIGNMIGWETVKMVVGLVGVLVFVVLNALILTWAERKVAGHMQRRIGPKEVGPYGLIQPIADALKLLGKEILTPREVDKPLYYLAPMIIFVPVLVSFVVIPFDASLQVMDINVGILVILAFSSLSVFSILMAGWGSNNKYALIGAIRSIAQNIAYEIPLLLALLPIIMMTNSFSLKSIVEAQHGLWFVVYQPFAFLIYFIAGVAETNRTPFDLPEAESELVAGYHTEYSGMRFALFFLAEYTNIFIVSAIAVTFFLGGYQGPFLPGIIWFLLKSYLLVFVIMWLRWTYPRVRFDQLLNISWKALIPLSFINLLITGGLLKL